MNLEESLIPLFKDKSTNPIEIFQKLNTLSTLLNINPYKEQPVYIPNEIFKDFESLEYQHSSHYTFLICCYILISYLYQHCLYAPQSLITQNTIKLILGYSVSNKQLDYLIKKDGLLDQSQYTNTTRDIPCYKEEKDFIYYSQTGLTPETKSAYTFPPRYLIKYPIRLFHRSKEDLEHGELTGTYYQVENTTKIDMRMFFLCMLNPNLQCYGFATLLYLKKNLYCQNSIKKKALALKISEKEIKRILKELELLNFINVYHKDFYVFHEEIEDEQKEFECNTYQVNEFRNISYIRDYETYNSVVKAKKPTHVGLNKT